MGRRTSKPDSRSPWGCIIAGVSPLILLFAFMGWRMLNGGPNSPEDVADARRREQAVSSALAEFGATSRPGSGVFVITLPQRRAMDITARQAKELALTARSRLGGIVRVQTPAGQVLAEAP